MTVDWTQPICLDTVPPRRARVTGKTYNFLTKGLCREVSADWDGKIPDLVWVADDGEAPYMPDLPPFRNVRPGDFPDETAPAPDLAAIAAELAEALWLIADIEPDADNMGRFHDIANAALAKWEQTK